MLWKNNFNPEINSIKLNPIFSLKNCIRTNILILIQQKLFSALKLQKINNKLTFFLTFLLILFFRF